MARHNAPSQISISDASRLGISSLVRAAEEGDDVILLRGDKPVAAIVSMERLDQLQHLTDDLQDTALVAARMLTTGPKRYTLDQVLADCGSTSASNSPTCPIQPCLDYS